ncbi:hypothetical protein [Nocardia mexicana]|uniref:hypothetical protein n=1 Tax=Nocardia mexicana TaxID=279262 RepID=UPI0014723D54|nr:hypothetical protein [Nocardia mexicana]
MEYFDPERWHPRAVRQRCGRWIGATRRRRRTVWSLVVVFLVIVLPAAVGAVSFAASGGEPVTAGASGLLDARDSDGVEVSQYTVALDHGGILDPGNTILYGFIVSLAAIIVLFAALWLWGLFKAIDLSWLDPVREPLLGAAQAFANQIGTLTFALLALSIGVLMPALNFARGLIAKAVRQISALFLFGIFSAFFLTNPLAHELSSDGWLAQGRDVGLSVAAGMNGDNNPNPATLIPTMQGHMADNFIRKPLQVMNFGHVVDRYPACKAAWSAGVRSGSEEQIKNGLKSCGDTAALASANNPRASQIGIGFLLILIQLILVIGFGFMAVNLVRTVLAIFFNGFLIIFGFAAGAYVPGPSQTLTIRSLMHTVFAVLKFMFYCGAAGMAALISNSVMSQAKDGAALPVLTLWAFLMLIGVIEFRHMRDSFGKGQDWASNQASLAVSGATAGGGGGGGGGGGRALGMGDASAGTNHFKMMAAMAGANTISSFAPLEWAVGGIPGFGHPMAKAKRDEARANRGKWKHKGYGGKRGWNAISNMKWETLSKGARDMARLHGGLDTIVGNAAAVHGTVEAGGFVSESFAAMYGAGAKNEKMSHYAMRSWRNVQRLAEREPFADKDLSFLAASIRHAQNRTIAFINGKDGVTADMLAADYGTMRMASTLFRETQRGGINLPQKELDLVNKYMDDPDMKLSEKKEFISALKKVSTDGHSGLLDPNTGHPDPNVAGHSYAAEFHARGIDSKESKRMLRWITNEDAKRVEQNTRGFLRDVTNQDAMRSLRNVADSALETHGRMAGETKIPSLSVTPHSGSAPDPDWDRRWRSDLAPVAKRMRSSMGDLQG